MKNPIPLQNLPQNEQESLSLTQILSPNVIKSSLLCHQRNTVFSIEFRQLWFRKDQQTVESN